MKKFLIFILNFAIFFVFSHITESMGYGINTEKFWELFILLIAIGIINFINGTLSEN